MGLYQGLRFKTMDTMIEGHIYHNNPDNPRFWIGKFKEFNYDAATFILIAYQDPVIERTIGTPTNVWVSTTTKDLHIDITYPEFYSLTRILPHDLILFSYIQNKTRHWDDYFRLPTNSLCNNGN